MVVIREVWEGMTRVDVDVHLKIEGWKNVFPRRNAVR